MCFDAVANYSPILAVVFQSSIEDAKRAYRLFRINPAHPSPRFKRIEEDIYSVRVGLGYRALAVMKSNQALWYWIGSHSDYDKLV
jgi:hypothetical protein